MAGDEAAGSQRCVHGEVSRGEGDVMLVSLLCDRVIVWIESGNVWRMEKGKEFTRQRCDGDVRGREQEGLLFIPVRLRIDMCPILLYISVLK